MIAKVQHPSYNPSMVKLDLENEMKEMKSKVYQAKVTVNKANGGYQLDYEVYNSSKGTWGGGGDQFSDFGNMADFLNGWVKNREGEGRKVLVVWNY